MRINALCKKKKKIAVEEICQVSSGNKKLMTGEVVVQELSPVHCELMVYRIIEVDIWKT